MESGEGKSTMKEEGQEGEEEQHPKAGVARQGLRAHQHQGLLGQPHQRSMLRTAAASTLGTEES